MRNVNCRPIAVIELRLRRLKQATGFRKRRLPSVAEVLGRVGRMTEVETPSEIQAQPLPNAGLFAVGSNRRALRISGSNLRELGQSAGRTQSRGYYARGNRQPAGLQKISSGAIRHARALAESAYARQCLACKSCCRLCRRLGHPDERGQHVAKSIGSRLPKPT